MILAAAFAAGVLVGALAVLLVGASIDRENAERRKYPGGFDWDQR